MHDDLPHAMRETARRLEPDVARLAVGGVERGTRMRRIERAVQVAGSVVAVAVVFAGVTLLGPHRAVGSNRAVGPGGGGGGAVATGTATTVTTGTTGTTGKTGTIGVATTTGAAAATSTITATAPSSTTTSTAPSPAATSTGIPQIPGDQLVSTLKSALADTGVTGLYYVSRGSDFDPISVSAQLTALHQLGSLVIIFYGHQDQPTRTGTPHVLPDGSIAYVTKQPGSSDGRHADKTDLTVVLVRPDGTSLNAEETNAANIKGAAAPGAQLLLTSDQLIAMLDSSVWDTALAAADAQ